MERERERERLREEGKGEMHGNRDLDSMLSSPL